MDSDRIFDFLDEDDTDYSSLISLDPTLDGTFDVIVLYLASLGNPGFLYLLFRTLIPLVGTVIEVLTESEFLGMFLAAKDVTLLLTLG